MPLNGLIPANFPSDVLYDAGILMIGSSKFGVTKGPPKWAPNRTFENMAFDGKYAPVKGADRIMHGECSLSFSMLELGNATTGNQILTLEPGATLATATGTTTYTPQSSGTLLAAGAYIADFRAIWERGNSAGYFAVHLPVALCMKYDIAGTDKSEAMVSVEMVGRIDLATQPMSAAPYTLEYRAALP
jgi:hypothetical protein